MYATTITEPTDRSYPFSRALFENPSVVYHGTWSIYAARVESAGFGGVDVPFDHRHIETIMLARELIGIGSYAGPVFFHDAPPKPRAELSMTGSFWHARAYATDGGGEVVRIMLKEAKDFEALCSEEPKRLALKAHWEEALKGSPRHAPTLKAVEFLGDKDALQATERRVKQAREAIESVIRGGCPIVYAISVEPQWFGETWETYLWHWENRNHGAVELRCSRDLVMPDRIIAKAMFPNGTDPDFMPTWIRTWAEAEALSQGN
jgi:hypothetical protein